MSDDVWKSKLERGERLPLDRELTEYVLKTIGISPNKVNAVLTSLLAKGRDTWGSVLALTDFDKVKDATGDQVSAETLWNFIEKENAKSAGAAGKLSVFI